MGREYIRDTTQRNVGNVAGDIVLYEDFENALFLWPITAGDNGTVARTTAAASVYQGGGAMLMTQSATGVIANPATRAQRLIGAMPSGISVLDFMANVRVSSPNATMGFDSRADTGIAIVITGLRIAYSAAGVGSLQVETGDDTWTNVGLASDVPRDLAWARFILRANIGALRYVSLQVNARLIDLSALSTPTIDTDGLQQHTVLIQVFDTLDNGASLAIDNILFRVE